MVIPEYFKTEVEGKTIRIKVEQYLTENQREIDHNYFFKIYNNLNLQFAAGRYLLTLKRKRPAPYMQSVWVLENVEIPVESSGVSLIGIVAGADKNQPDLYYVWTKERPVGQDITIRSKNISLGTWITMRIPKDQMNKYALETKNYSMMEKSLYPTEIMNGTIALKLELWLTANSREISHPFVGNIIKKTTNFSESGKYLITIKRQINKKDVQPIKSVWHLIDSKLIELESTHVASIAHPRQSLIDQNIQRGQNSFNNRARSKSRGRSMSRARVQDNQIELNGIVVANGTGCKYVFCKERLPGNDIKINDDSKLGLGKWVQFRISQQEMDEFFPKEMPSNGEYPMFWCQEFTEIPEIHPTKISGQKKAILLELELDIKENSRVEDLWHPSVNYIINESYTFPQSGKYLLTVIRGKNRTGLVKSVWFLREYKLLEPTNQHNSSFDQMTPQRQSLIDQNIQRGQNSFNNRATSSSRGRSMSRSRADNSRFDQMTPQRHVQFDHYGRSSSRPRGILKNANPIFVSNVSPNPDGPSSSSQPARYSYSPSQMTPQPDTYLPSLSPIPAPRTIGTTPRQSQTNENQTGIIIGINYKGSYEMIFVWLIAEKTAAALKLTFPSGKLNLGLGSFFSAPFTNENGRWSSSGPVTIVDKIDGVSTRVNGQGGVELQVYAEGLHEPDHKHFNYPWIPHDYFGDIIDNRGQLEMHGKVKYHMIIKRSRVKSEENFQWVVVEQIRV
ncbi:hypothetical protein GCK72_010855 [Caenorhabditis remanei]|uniref:Uncharacterized protein n=1 Tax=Caenorhabditis remanei TaxID=31234 RepID=A0A6A5H7V8_CAERE|nr:hypothetical protein GCK72_010855 [Caenorhabditis remanei]KAF1762593.1 hypothetical protein GCK72_010855 [Caenorhabditis remanei]